MSRKIKSGLVSAALLLILALALTVCSACTANINIRFVDRAGNDIVFSETRRLPESGSSEALSARDETLPDASVSASADPEAASAADADVPAQTTGEAPDAFPAPDSVQSILAFYRSAVQSVRSGAAGYGKKTWESAQVLQATGIAAVDRFINTELEKRATSEADAETVYYEKGSAQAAASFPACTLTDTDRIVSAACEPKGENVVITITMQDENTPASVDDSMLGEITDIILFENEIERNLRETLPSVTDYEYSLLYKGFEVRCELTKDGRFVSLTHHAYAEVHVSTVRLLFFTAKNKDGILTMDALFSDFVY